MNDFNKLKSGSRSPHTLHYLVWRFLPCLLVYYYYYYYYYYCKNYYYDHFTTDSALKKLKLSKN